MVRWLLTVLLFVLPAQFVWAAAAPYCGHDISAGRAHRSHLVHKRVQQPVQSQAQQDATPSDEGVAAKSPPAGDMAHFGCTDCNGVAAPQVVIDVRVSTLPALDRRSPVSVTRFKSCTARDIERPKWPRTAPLRRGGHLLV